MKRNAITYFSNVPTPSLPRNRFDQKVQVDLGTLKHGRLQLINAQFVYPDSTWDRYTSELVQADTFDKFPLDSVLMDTYDFFVPLRIIHKDFAKVFGDVEPYDTNVYTFPEFELDFSTSNPLTHDTILKGAGWSCPVNQLFDYDTTNHYWKPKSTTTTFDKINPYTLMAYYCVYNEYFRDANVDPSIPFEDLMNSKLSQINATLFNNLEALPVNKFHDRYTSGLLTPSKAIAGIPTPVTLPLGVAAPVYTKEDHVLAMGANRPPLHWAYANGIYDGKAYLGVNGNNDGNPAPTVIKSDSTPGTTQVTPSNLWADLSLATAAPIESLKLALDIESLGQIKSAYGSRMSSYYRGVWGITVPDYMLDRPEYLGGHRFDLSMVPVLNQASLLGAMSAHSRTASDKSNFTKSFFEFGILLRLACVRHNRTYSQGITNPALRFKDELDLYNRMFSNLGNVEQKVENLYNDFTNAGSKLPFNYNEYATELRTQVSTTFGDFSPMHGDSTELMAKWSFQDVYTQAPSFGASWLKEDDNNVRRTMTGRVIPNATASYGHQYAVAFIRHDFVTLPLRASGVAIGFSNRI